MLCQSCGKHAATTHIKSYVNGQLTELHLCPSCAKEQGYTAGFSDWSALLGGLLGIHEPQQPQRQEVKRCPGCGASYQEIAQSAKMGCAECYKTFRAQLLPVIQKIHGSAQHKGKSPGGSALRVTGKQSLVLAEQPKLSPVEEKKRLMQKAIEAQDFEQAAVLRDEIKELEKNG